MKYAQLFLLIFIYPGIGACKKNNATKVYRIEETINIKGVKRKYLLNLPPNYYEKNGFSLVIALHGGGGNVKQFESTSMLSRKANKAGFVIYPEGSGVIRTWNAGTCCGYATKNNINDVEFISKLIDKIVSSYKIDSKRVYATGHSNGGMLCYKLACELSTKIAAIAPNASTMIAEACNPARAVPILHMHSINDEHIPYRGGTGNGVSRVYAPPLDSVLNVWSIKNGCAGTPKISGNNNAYQLTSWTNCSGSSEIEYYLTKDGGHSWPSGLPGGSNSDSPAISINANDLLWEFFSRHQLPN